MCFLEDVLRGGGCPALEAGGSCVDWFYKAGLAKPFAAALDETSRVEIMPFRGKNIFHNTNYEDVVR